MRVLPLSLSVLALAMMAPVTALPALAQNALPLAVSLPEGQTVLNIAATERAQIQQDLLIATLRVDQEGSDAKTIQNDINALMKKALDAAKAVPEVKASTGQYYVYQNDPNPRPVEKGQTALPKTWRGSQSMELRSTSADILLKLVGDLQEAGLVVGGLSYTLSPDKADQAKDALMEQALAKVTARAERAAKAMNKASMALIEVNVDTSDNIGQPYMMRAMAMESSGSAKMATPVAEAGETEITLTVTAKALLKP